MMDTTTALLQQSDDALARELLCVQRRYHGSMLPTTSEGVHVQCVLSLSDPDLTPAFKGETEILVTFPPKYPHDVVRLDLRSWQQRMNADQFDALEAAVARRAAELQGTFGVEELLTWLDNNVARFLQAPTPPVEVEQPEKTQEMTPVEETEKDANKRSGKACRYMLRGSCKRGNKCKFSHEKAKALRQHKKTQPKQTSVETPDTKDELHRSASPAEIKATPTEETSVEPMKQPDSDANAKKTSKSKKPATCKFFAKGACRDGDNCKFSHKAKRAYPKLSKAAILNPSKPKGITIAVIGEAPALPDLDDMDSFPRDAPPPTPDVPLSRPEDWTSDQQRALDAALKQYPATLEKRERWTAIASEVDGKTLNDCIDRFKLVSELVKTGEPVPIVTPPAASVSPSQSMLSTSVPTTQKHEKRRVRLTDPKDDELELHAKITPEDRRLPVETKPVVGGTEIRLEDLFLYEIGTLVPHCIVCQVQCTQCPLQFDVKLTLDRDGADTQKWCPRCSAKHVVSLHPAFTHAQSNVLAYIDTENCAIVDVLPSDVLASCLACGHEALLEGIVPGRRAEQACFSCFTKLAMMTKRVAVGGASDSVLAASAGDAIQLKKTKRVADMFVLGQPLPRNGACDHYRHSHRWFRFQCCGKALPCGVCHDESDCEEANTGKLASRIICGFCAKEQSSAVKECACGNAMRRSVTTNHWEGGTGCRDPTRMSAHDRQKFHGRNKTESQKCMRVGVQGKQRIVHTVTA